MLPVRERFQRFFNQPSRVNATIYLFALGAQRPTFAVEALHLDQFQPIKIDTVSFETGGVEFQSLNTFGGFQATLRDKPSN